MSLPMAQPSPATGPEYWDLRDPSRFHVEPTCSVGRWIPNESMQLGRPADATPCSECAPAGARAGSFLFAI